MGVVDHDGRPELLGRLDDAGEWRDVPVHREDPVGHDEDQSVLAEDVPQELRTALSQVQQDLFDLGGELSIPGHAIVAPAQVRFLDQRIEAWNAELEPLKEFILPGGTRAAAAAHLARTICRRAERSLVNLGQKEKINDQARHYLNRLSDLLFVAGRHLNRHAGRSDVQWRHERKKR